MAQNKQLAEVKKLESQEREKTSVQAQLDDQKNAFWRYAKKYTRYTREQEFEVNEENKDVIIALIQYFNNNELFWQNKTVENEPSLRKGIWLAGNTGSGKTLLLEIFSKLTANSRYEKFEIKSTREMNRLFNSKGHDGIAKYSFEAVKANGTQIVKMLNVAFDDLGNEETETVHFNNTISVMEHILDERYRLFSQYKLMTHVTTNLSMDEIESRYGQRIRSRISEMFNIIYLGGDETSTDMRNNQNPNN